MQTASSAVAILATLRPYPGVEQIRVDACFFPGDKWVQFSTSSDQSVHVLGMMGSRAFQSSRSPMTPQKIASRHERGTRKLIRKSPMCNFFAICQFALARFPSATLTLFLSCHLRMWRQHRGKKEETTRMCWCPL